jgi:copper(I)-binding protein
MGDSNSTSMSDGSMTMRQVKSIEIPADGMVMLKPGGFHIMLMELAKPLVKGETFDLTLHFEKAGDKTVTVTVKDA